MTTYLVEIHYTVDGTPRISRPRSIRSSHPEIAKTVALGNFASGRDGRRVKITKAVVR